MNILRSLLFLILVAAAIRCRACDLCGCYTPQMETAPEMPTLSLPSWISGSYAAVAEQFTRYGTLQLEGNEVPNPTDQYLNSSITQLVAGYSFSHRFALQVSVPLIFREFKRPEGFRIDRGTVSGLGDVSLLLRSVIFHYTSAVRPSVEVEGKNAVAVESDPDFSASAVLLHGIKFPTGATSRLKEEFHEIEIPGAPVSGIHGHDLTLGTGSYDGIFGERNTVRYKNVFLETNVEFTLRGDGAHQYHFANDLAWGGGPGYYLVRNRHTLVGAQFEISGEHKDVDRFRGKPADDTGITAVFAGPRIVASRGSWSAEIAGEFPVLIDNTALQAVPDFRLRTGIAVHF